jgi:hypothetical protein
LRTRQAFEVNRFDQKDYSMRNKEKMIVLSAARLEEHAAGRVGEAEQLPLGEARQHVLNNAAIAFICRDEATTRAELRNRQRKNVA